MNNRNRSCERLTRDLRALGIGAGDTLIVHSSLSSMGHVEGGAETVIRALTDVLGEEGTLLFPAFTYRTSNVTSEFSLPETPVCIGAIPETFRRMPGVLRSFHPSHSVCAIGAHAEEMVRDHGLDDTPMGVHSPYRKLPEYDGKILMLGCGLSPNSFMHGMEELAGVSYVLGNPQIYRMTDANGNVTEKAIRRHNFNRPEGRLIQCYKRVPEVLDEAVGDYVTGTVHGAEATVFRTVPLQAKAVAKMKEDETYFIDDPDGILK